MNNDRIPIDLFNCELEEEDRDRWVHLLWYKDVRQRDLRALDIDVSSWETIASDRDAWKHTLKHQLPKGEEKWKGKIAEKRASRTEKVKASKIPQMPTFFACPNCGRDCKACIGRLSHSKKCPRKCCGLAILYIFLLLASLFTSVTSSVIQCQT